MDPLQNNNQSNNAPAGNAVPARPSIAIQNNRVENSGNDETSNNTDNFTSSNSNNNSAEVNKKRDFSLGRAFNFFLKGLVSPILTMIKNPFETLLILTGGLLVAAFVPSLIPLMIYGGIGFGVFQLGKGGYNIVQGIKEKDGEKIENAFENFGNGTFDILTLGLGKGIITRGFKLFGKLTKTLIKETAQWYRSVFFPQVMSLNPTALACAGLNIAEGAHAVHSAATLNASGTVMSLGAFAVTKYIYMGFHYRKPLTKTIELLNKSVKGRKSIIDFIKNSFKEFFSQASSYIFRRNRNVTLGAIAEGFSINEIQGSIFLRLSQLVKSPNQKAYFEHLANLARTNPNSPEFVTLQQSMKSLINQLPQIAKTLPNTDIPALQQTLRTLSTQLPGAARVLNSNTELTAFQQTLVTLSTQLSQANSAELTVLQQTLVTLSTQLPQVSRFVNNNAELVELQRTLRTLNTQVSQISNNAEIIALQKELNILFSHYSIFQAQRVLSNPDVLQVLQNGTNGNNVIDIQRLLNQLLQRRAPATA